MKVKMYLMRVDENVVIGFSQYEKNGLGSAILDAKGLSKSEIERTMTYRFHAQRHQVSVKQDKPQPDFAGYTIIWLDFNEVVGAHKSPELELDGEPRIWTIEEKDGHYKPIKLETEPMTATECKLEIMKRMGF